MTAKQAVSEAGYERRSMAIILFIHYKYPVFIWIDCRSFDPSCELPILPSDFGSELIPII